MSAENGIRKDEGDGVVDEYIQQVQELPRMINWEIVDFGFIYSKITKKIFAFMNVDYIIGNIY